MEEHPNARVDGEFLWSPKTSRWAFPLLLTVNSANESLVPATTRWYVLLDPSYPAGDIDFYPAKDGGIDKTFPHQNNNSEGDVKLPWRAGDICIRAAGFVLGRAGDDPDPKGESLRLIWYVDSALEWLRRASADELRTEGDDFELPQWDAALETVGFTEDANSLTVWSTCDVFQGTAELISLGEPFPYAVRQFSSNGKIIHTPAWGFRISEAREVQTAGWIRLHQVPTLSPYAAPMTWGELYSIIDDQGLDTSALFEPALSPLRDGKAHVLLVGFPIPRRVGEDPTAMHWQPIQLPVLSNIRKPTNGFRANAKGVWLGDRVKGVLSDKKPLAWMTGRNWHESELGTRGQLSPQLRERTICIIGAGAIGSSMAELLVRGGVQDVVLVDSDTCAAGNLVRHTLSVSDVGSGKAEHVADRLNGISPHARVRAIPTRIEKLSDSQRTHYLECDLILDCSGSDDVLRTLASDDRESQLRFFSVSVGRGAKRLYSYAADGLAFPFEEFADHVRPWLVQDEAEFADQDFPWEGIGCWHPVFPATGARIALFAAAAVEQLDYRMRLEQARSALTVLQSDDSSAQLRVVKLHG